jgi:hypothetical protein
VARGGLVRRGCRGSKAIAQHTLKEWCGWWRYVGLLGGAISLKVHPFSNHSLLFLNLLNAYS